jgi:serine/threonine-protein phosphatase 2A activator
MAASIPRSAQSARIPTLDILDPASLPKFTKPVKQINDGHDVSHFLASLAYRDIGLFVLQLNHALCPRQQTSSPVPRTFPLSDKPSTTPSIVALQTLLSKVENLMTEAPPAPGPRRFGNVSFRQWHSLLQQRLDTLLDNGLLSETLGQGEGSAREEVISYFLGGFGSDQRLDYGTGHELSFLAFLGCL